MKVTTLSVAGLVMAASSAARGQVLMQDDFNDGNDDGWIHVDPLKGTPFGPTNYDLSGGRYAMSSAAPIPLGLGFVAAGAVWGESAVNPAYSDGVLQATVRMHNASSNVIILARYQAIDRGYGFFLNNQQDFIGLADAANTHTNLGGEFVAIDENTDYRVECRTNGPRFSLRVWKTGEPRPEAPQVVVWNSLYVAGAIGLAAYTVADGGALAASFDDVSFTAVPPCPADCDTATGDGVLDIFDFLCFQNLYAAFDPHACNCDTTSGWGVCDILDFLCFQNAFAAGCP